MGMLLVSRTYWLGMPFHFRKSVPEGTKIEPVYLKADDLRDCQGLYYTPPKVDKPKVAVLAAHPRADFAKHYSIPRLLEAGVACFGLQTRCLNNDTQAIHEELILDVNAAVKFLKKQKGIEKVILFGNSGGGSLFAFFQAQAILPKEKRITHTPAGDLTRLPGAEMIPADGLILVSCHKGEGRIMNECIDPSVVDEFDPSLTNPELDMYDERNGFKPPPEWSKYSKEFLEKFRKAQHARVKRLDDLAHGYIEDARKADKLFNKAKSEKWSFADTQAVARRAAQERVMVIYRTMANPPYVDNSIDPSPRPYGSLLSDRPDLMNFQYLGFGRIQTPQAWLSTWSGISSNADLIKNLAHIPQPVLVVNAEKDNEIFPKTDAEPIWNAVVAKDKTYWKFDNALHYFEPPFGSKEAPDVEALMDKLVPWVLERFG